MINKAGRETVAWALGAIATLIAIWGYVDAQHEPSGTVAAALEVMLGVVEDDRAADLYWLNEKEKNEGLTPHEVGRKGSIEAGLRRIERKQRALDDE